MPGHLNLTHFRLGSKVLVTAKVLSQVLSAGSKAGDVAPLCCVVSVSLIRWAESQPEALNNNFPPTGSGDWGQQWRPEGGRRCVARIRGLFFILPVASCLSLRPAWALAVQVTHMPGWPQALEQQQIQPWTYCSLEAFIVLPVQGLQLSIWAL